MATIINNGVTSENSVLRIENPYIQVIDDATGEALPNANLYFGLVGRDPELPENRKIVYAIQENGEFVPLEQPVVCSPGGVPQNNGQSVVLAVDGSFSYKVNDQAGSQFYYLPRYENPTLSGLSGVVVEESQTVQAGGQLPGSFTTIEASTATFYASTVTTGTEFNGELMRVDVDYRVDDETTITLLTTYAPGVVVLGRQNDPTGQTVPVNQTGSALFVFDLIADAVAADLSIGTTLTINGSASLGDGLGGSRYVVVAGGTGTDDGETFIDLTNGNQLQLISNESIFGRYLEKVATASSIAAILNIDLNMGSSFESTLTENVSDIVVGNINQAGLQQSFTVKFTQDGVGGRSITWPAAFLWAGGVAPTITVAPNAVDLIVFTTYDGGATWIGAVVGQDIQ